MVFLTPMNPVFSHIPIFSLHHNFVLSDKSKNDNPKANSNRQTGSSHETITLPMRHWEKELSINMKILPSNKYKMTWERESSRAWQFYFYQKDTKWHVKNNGVYRVVHSTLSTRERESKDMEVSPQSYKNDMPCC